jgi:hypothetical protein
MKKTHSLGHIWTTAIAGHGETLLCRNNVNYVLRQSSTIVMMVTGYKKKVITDCKADAMIQ